MSLPPVGTGGKDVEQLLSEAETAMRRASQAEAQAKQAQKAAQKSAQSGQGGGGEGGGSGGAQNTQRASPQTQNAAREMNRAGETAGKNRCGACPADNEPSSPSSPASASQQPASRPAPVQAFARATPPASAAPPAAPAAASEQPSSPPASSSSSPLAASSSPASSSARPQSVASAQTASRPDRTMKRGDRGEDVRAMQQRLNAHGASPKLAEDGKFGPKTQAALNSFQRSQGMRSDGSAGPRTREALGRDPVGGNTGTGGTRGSGSVDEPAAAPGNAGGNNTATFNRISNRGQVNQMASGTITVNGHQYQFNSGGHGRGNLPAGDYQVSNLRGTQQAGMVRDGVGFKADLSDKRDPRLGGATRTELRIHPDGGSAGTNGCIGIVGDRATLQRFQRDLAAELQRNGGRFTLHVG